MPVRHEATKNLLDPFFIDIPHFEAINCQDTPFGYSLYRPHDIINTGEFPFETTLGNLCKILYMIWFLQSP